MHKKFEINQTKIKGGCQSGRKVVAHDSKSDLPLAKSHVCQNGKVFSGMFLPLCTHDYRWALPLAIKMTSIALNEIQVQWDGIYFDWKSTCDFANKKTCRTSKLIFFQ